jgi:hypothetical protein
VTTARSKYINFNPLNYEEFGGWGVAGEREYKETSNP